MKFRRRLARAVNRTLDRAPPATGPNAQLLSGKILLHDNFLDADEFIALQRWAFAVETPRTREDRKWGEYLVRDFEENRGSRQWASDHDDMPDEPRRFVEKLRKEKIIKDSDVIHLGVYRWERLSGMGVHTDSHTDTALTFYLNDVWHQDWGGDFTYYESQYHLDKGIGHSVAPAANRLVVNHSTIAHKVNYCSTTAQDRVTLQSFLYRG